MVTKKLIPKKKAFQEGDWVICDMDIGQVGRIRDDVYSFRNGYTELSGYNLHERFRPLTLTNKNIAEFFHSQYKELRRIDGSAGFNFPDISCYFSQLVLDAIDSTEVASPIYQTARDFVKLAKSYCKVIYGIKLFRSAA